MAFAVYKASAGSGKTFSLVREYLKIVLQEPSDFRHVLAITFTNKAANEMKDRVLKTLSGLAKGDLPADDKMLSCLMKDTHFPAEVIFLKAREAMELILHQYADFAIGTIDSFSHRIIRTFAHDFGLPVNFNVEMDTDMLLETTVDLLLDRIGEDHDLTGLLVDFLEARMDDDSDWKIDRELVQFAKNLLDETGQDHLQRIRKITLRDFRQISSSVHARAKEIGSGLGTTAQEALSLIRSKAIPDEAFSRGRQGFPSFFANIVKGNFAEPNSYVRTTVEEDKWTSQKCTTEQAAAIASIRDTLLDLYEHTLSALHRDLPLLTLLNLLKKSIYPLAVLNEIGKTLDEFKKQNNLVHISEFNTRISRIIMGEPVPFIYERLGEKYRHILIDEFQDTSAMQWMNFIPLIENSLASGYFNLVVGDGKQAIYRFRNGDAEQFTSLPGIAGSQTDPVLKQREEILEQHFVAVPLKMNFRSGKEIVEFNNRFFKILTEALFPEGNSVYQDLEQVPGPGMDGGYIHIEIAQKEEGKDVAADTLQRILELAGEAMADGYRKNEIAILCRSNRNASEVARFLLLNGIDVISAESLLVSHSPHVGFITAFIRFLHEMPDPVIHAELAVYLSRHAFTERPVHALLTTIREEAAPGSGLMDIFRECGLEIRPNQLAGLPVYDLVETLIRTFRMNDPADPYLQFFLDAVLRFTVRVSTSARDFLEWWEDNRNKVSIVVPEGMDAVKVMTIHKAKGLQFPVVIYAFANEYKKNTREWLWAELTRDEVPGLSSAILRSEKALLQTSYAGLLETEDKKSLLDLLNLMYVAMTRPEERLYVLTGAATENGELQSLPRFFAYVLRQMGLFEEGRVLYPFGKPAKKRRGEDPGGNKPIRLEKLISGEWRKKIHVRTHAPEMWDMDQPMHPSLWGNRIHTILAKVITKEGLPDVLDDAVLSGLIRGQEREAVEQLILPVFSHPMLAKLFSEGVTVRTETEILVPGGLFYRPDRVVIDQDKVFVVDYKTGRQNERHRTQLNQYAGLLEEMGYENISRVLVYLEPKLHVVRF